MTPLMFVGHGSPTTILSPDDYHKSLIEGFRQIKSAISAVVVLSAHWLTKDEIRISTQLDQETIYDFHGFPESLYKIKYKASGDEQLANKIAHVLKPLGLPIILDSTRGLDHGAWEPLAIAFPDPKVPVFQVSIPYPSNEEFLMKMGVALKPFRNEGVLFIGSGDLVHNLRAVYWDEPYGLPVSWAQDFESWICKNLDKGDWLEVAKWQAHAPEGAKAHPYPDHLFPLFPILGAAEANEKIQYLYKGFHFRTISMTSFLIK